ncbi:MAG: FHA domain-containing protein [Phycisphaeraceae bacterium]|nr:FHA domain-containing protein [Phycisphaeraceae bacterium]
MNATLVLVQPDGSLKEIPLTKQVTVMGRQTDCQLRIPSAGVSRHHCEVVLSEGGVKVRDLGSSNGTFVNKQKVDQKDLSPGDMISIGGLVFVLRVDGKPQFIDAEDAIEDGLVEGVSGDQPAAKPSAPTLTPGSAFVPKPQPKPAGKKSLIDSDPDGSSVGDFNFLDEDDEDLKKQPKL